MTAVAPAVAVRPVGTVGGTTGVTVNVAEKDAEPRVAVITGEEFAETAEVVTVALAVVWPAATVTVEGTVAAAVMLELRLTTVPPVGAGPLRVTVAVEGLPPTTDVGERAMAVSVGAVMTRFFVIGLPLKLAVMPAVVFVLTALVTIEKVT